MIPQSCVPGLMRACGDPTYGVEGEAEPRRRRMGAGTHMGTSVGSGMPTSTVVLAQPPKGRFREFWGGKCKTWGPLGAGSQSGVMPPSSNRRLLESFCKWPPQQQLAHKEHNFPRWKTRQPAVGALEVESENPNWSTVLLMTQCALYSHVASLSLIRSLSLKWDYNSNRNTNPRELVWRLQR